MTLEDAFGFPSFGLLLYRPVQAFALEGPPIPKPITRHLGRSSCKQHHTRILNLERYNWPIEAALFPCEPPPKSPTNPKPKTKNPKAKASQEAKNCSGRESEASRELFGACMLSMGSRGLV